MRALLLDGISLPLAALAAEGAGEFAKTTRPVLQANRAGCHNPANPKNWIDFLKAMSVKDVESRRGLWRRTPPCNLCLALLHRMGVMETSCAGRTGPPQGLS